MEGGAGKDKGAKEGNDGNDNSQTTSLTFGQHKKSYFAFIS